MKFEDPSIDDMARKHFPYMPTGLFLKHHLDNAKRIRAVKCPIFLAHGTHDSIIPFTMSKTLASTATSPVTKYDVIDGDHNDVFDVGGTKLLDAIEQFVNEHVAI